MRTFAELVDSQSRIINDFLNTDNLSNRSLNSLSTGVSLIHSFTNHRRNQVGCFGKGFNGSHCNVDGVHGVVDKSLLFNNRARRTCNRLRNLFRSLGTLMSTCSKFFGRSRELAGGVACLLNNFAYSLAHFADGKSHCAKFVFAVGVKQISTTEVAVFEQVQSLNHIGKRIGNGFGNHRAEENQDNNCAAEYEEQIADSGVNAFVGTFNRVFGILISLLLNNQNCAARRNGIRHYVTLIKIHRCISVSGNRCSIAARRRTHLHHFIAAGFELSPFTFCGVNLSASLRIVFDNFFVES